MKILIVTVDPAFPAISGADLRSWQNVQAASDLGDVLLVSIVPPGPEIPSPGIATAHLAGVDTSVIWTSDFDIVFSAESIDRFQLLAARFQPDVIILESLIFANLVGVAKNCARCVVIDLHNVESDLVGQETATWKQRIFRVMDARVRRIRAIEQKAIQQADVAWVCSSIDRDRLAKDGADEKRIAVIPNGIPRPDSIRDEQRRKGAAWPVLLFIGHLGYPPNIDAALSLIELMPLLWRHHPESRLILAGRTPDPVIGRKARPGKIFLVPNPTSVQPLLLNADFAVIPLQRGGGTRIKVLEAMAWGLPVVATARAVEGLDLIDGQDVRLAETAEEFVTAIRELCADSTKYESQVLAARRHVMAYFGPEAVRTLIHTGLRSLVETKLPSNRTR